MLMLTEILKNKMHTTLDSKSVVSAKYTIYNSRAPPMRVIDKHKGQSGFYCLGSWWQLDGEKHNTKVHNNLTHMIIQLLTFVNSNTPESMFRPSYKK